jgi:transmembrane sensor
LVEILNDQQPEERLQRVWQGIRARRERRTKSSFASGQRRLLAIATCTSLLIVIAAWAWRWNHQRGESALPVASIPASIEPGKSSREVDFGAGARITVGAGARLDVLEQSERAVVLALRRGLSQFDIRPGGARRWRIESAGVTVEVVGTQFSVERSEQAVRVEVQRGRVLVRGLSVPDQVQALDVGRALVVQLNPPQRAGDEVDDSKSSQAASTGPLPLAQMQKAPAAMAPTSEAKPESNGWRSAATRQDWKQAWETLGAEGLARETARTDDVAELLALADVARLSGHPNEALTPLRQIVGGHSEDPRSAIAALTLGRVLLDSLANPLQAAFAFERALALKLPSSLAEDAQARLVEAHAKTGALAQAKAAADVYRTRYPGGRRIADVNRWSSAE